MRSMNRRSTTLAVLFTSLVVAGTSNSSGQGPDPCSRCNDAKGEWSWKANGYALAATSEQARVLALRRATESACDKSATYLDAQKLKCKGGCTAGELKNTCEPSKKPGCNTGTYADNKGMWTFVCRKHHQGDKNKPSCDAQEADKTPGYTMCDVSVKATRTLACAHPECAEAN